MIDIVLVSILYGNFGVVQRQYLAPCNIVLLCVLTRPKHFKDVLSLIIHKLARYGGYNTCLTDHKPSQYDWTDIVTL